MTRFRPTLGKSMVSLAFGPCPSTETIFPSEELLRDLAQEAGGRVELQLAEQAPALGQ
jgi:hypothetical protein